MLELVGQALAYSGVGLAILIAGYFLVDALTPGHLGRQVFEEGNLNAGVLLASALLSLGLIEWFAIFFTGGGWGGLDDALVFGLVGLVTQAVGFLVFDALTPGKTGEMFSNPRFQPAVAVSAAVQISVALVVCASLT